MAYAPPGHVRYHAYEGADANEYESPHYYPVGGGVDVYGTDEYEGEQDTVAFDAFDEEVLHQAQQADRIGHAAAGRARLSLPSTSTVDKHGHGVHYRHADAVGPSAVRAPVARPPISLRQYAYSSVEPLEASSSSSPGQAVSSPTARVAGRRYNMPGQNGYKHEEETTDHHHQTVGISREPPPEARHPQSISLAHAPPQTVHGIDLVPASTLPDRFRALFPFPLFNAVQSRCFGTAFRTDDNLVVSAPTGSGKTAILELAICRAACALPAGTFKIVYQAPTKALCSERFRDWDRKFTPLGLACAELTGDTPAADLLRGVQGAVIIITTPEKWDGMTRRWRDHEKLVGMVRLFLVDEVHILGEDRGAALEAVVSRMMKHAVDVGQGMRVVALSATVPNAEDVAAWLGRSPERRELPAVQECFGEEFRPVRLQKHVVGFQSSSGNEFAFDKLLDSKLPDIVSRFSQMKPIMVFCATRKAVEQTAKLLATWSDVRAPQDRKWKYPRTALKFTDHDLQHCAASSVCWHHAGMDLRDRQAVEAAFLSGEINIICCTSTLAVGINLPCHMVIIKNTVCYDRGAAKEYSDLEVMQMLGRAGRPQFDTSGVAVVMTRQEKVQRYQKMVSGQEVLESCLHLNLIEHLNAEVGLGTVTDAGSARRWLSGTFLYVRMRRNPGHYRLEGDVGAGPLDERLDRLCERDISLLQTHELVTPNPEQLKTTEYGDAMARYYVNFATMKIFLGLPARAQVKEIVTALAQASEFQELRFRSGEKPVYRSLNKDVSMRYPITVNLDLPWHKTSLILQSVLGDVEFPAGTDKAPKHKAQFNTEAAVIFAHASRLVRCIIDCALQRGDATAAGNALALARSLGARAWDDSPLQMRQIPRVGPVAVRKLANARITSLEELSRAEPHRIESALGKAPPFGTVMLDALKEFPKLRVSLAVIPARDGSGAAHKQTDEGVQVSLRAEIGLTNDKPPVFWRKRPVFVCFLAETSDGRKAHFARTSARALAETRARQGEAVVVQFTALLTDASQSVRCTVMCDEIAGTLREAVVKPNVPASLFAAVPVQTRAAVVRAVVAPANRQQQETVPNPTRKRSLLALDGDEDVSVASRDVDEFGDGDIDDSDLMGAAIGASEFRDIEEVEAEMDILTSPSNRGNGDKSNRQDPSHGRPPDQRAPTARLANGNYECNHRCKNKRTCRHLCCKEGMEQPSKRPPASKANNSSNKRKKSTSVADDIDYMDLVSRSKTAKKDTMSTSRQTTLDGRHVTITKRQPSRGSTTAIDQLDLRSESGMTSKPDVVPAVTQKESTVPVRRSTSRIEDTFFLGGEDEDDAVFDEAMAELADAQHGTLNARESLSGARISGDSSGTCQESTTSVVRNAKAADAPLLPLALSRGLENRGAGPPGREVETVGPGFGSAVPGDTASAPAGAGAYAADATVAWALAEFGDIFEVVAQ